MIVLLSVPGGTASAGGLDREGYGYGNLHAHHGACEGVYAASYRRKRPHYYNVNVVPGRYVWRQRRLRVGTIRRRGRAIPHYRTVRQRVLVRPVRYRVRKRHAARRWISEPVVIQGRSRFRRSGCEPGSQIDLVQ
ncbi:MAG: hypothetical protein ACR2O4_01235 [Hyphomicrobiaceae bacterium]